MTTRTLEIGALCPSISKQLAGLVSPEDANQLDRDNDAINRCYVMGYMPDAQADRARKKLLAKCQAAARRFAKAYNAAPALANSPLTGAQRPV